MPPKRKRADEDASAETSTAARSTRSSTRAKPAAPEAAPTPVKQAKKSTKATAEVTEEEPAPKRKRTSKVATKAETGETGPKRGRKKATTSEEVEPSTKPVTVSPHIVEAVVSRASQVSLSTTTSSQPSVQPQKSTAAAPPPVQIAKSASGKKEPYTPQRALDLFAQYADSDDPKVIGPEGFEQLFTDAEIPMDGALPLIFAWQMGAAEMAKISTDEWVKGTASLKISNLTALSIALSDLEKLLILKQPALRKPGRGDQDPYDRTAYHSYALDTQGAFTKLYSYCFTLAKPEGSRNIDMETTVAFWTVLLIPQYPIMQEVVDFIGEKKDMYRATNKDLWSMMLEFCQTVKPTLEDYEADGAWPTLLDDFVLWKKTDRGANPNGAA